MRVEQLKVQPGAPRLIQEISTGQAVSGSFTELWSTEGDGEPLWGWLAVLVCRPLTSVPPSIPAAEGTRCTNPPAGKPPMAAKRKGGLKLNAICAKLSRQVVVEKGAEAGSQAEGSPLRPRDKERSGPESGVTRAPQSEEDKRRAEIEKWVNGEYSEEPAPTPVLGRAAREGLQLPPEGVYMVQPQGCSDEEDHAQEPSKDSNTLEEKDLDGTASKDDSGPSAKQASGVCLAMVSGGMKAGKGSSSLERPSRHRWYIQGILPYSSNPWWYLIQPSKNWRGRVEKRQGRIGSFLSVSRPRGAASSGL